MSNIHLDKVTDTCFGTTVLRSRIRCREVFYQNYISGKFLGPNGGTVKVFQRFEADPDGSGYRLQQSLPFVPKTVSSVSAENSRPAANERDLRIASR